MSVACVPHMRPLGGFAAYGARELARLTDHAERTTRRWIADGLAPRFVVRCLEIMCSGALGLICAQWEGWSLRDGKLQSPEGAEFTPNEVRTIPLRFQQLAALELEIRRLSKAVHEEEREARAQRAPEPPRRDTPRGRGDFLDNLDPVVRDHLATLLESAARIARTTPAPFSHDDAPPFSSRASSRPSARPAPELRP